MTRSHVSLVLLFAILVSATASAQPVRILRQQCLGGSYGEGFCTVTPARDGGHLIAANTSSNDGDVTGLNLAIPGYPDAWLVKIDSAGRREWARCYGGTFSENVRQLLATPDGGFIFVASTNSSDGDVQGWHPGADQYDQRHSDLWIVKLDSMGGIEWQRTFGGTGRDHAGAICPAYGGGYIVAGATSSSDGDLERVMAGARSGSDAFIMKIDEKGRIEWTRLLGGAGGESIAGISQTRDSTGYILSGSTGSADIPGYHPAINNAPDIWVARLDRRGSLLWQRALGGSGNDDAGISYRILQTRTNGFVVIGRLGSIDGDALPTGSALHDSMITASGRSDAWILWLDSAGTLLRQRGLGGAETDDGVSLCALSDGSLVVVGYTCSDEIELGVPRGAPGDYDGWIVRLDPAGRTLWQTRVGGSSFDDLQDVVVISDSTLLLVGSTQSNDGDVSGQHAGVGGRPMRDIWTAALAIDRRGLINKDDSITGRDSISRIPEPHREIDPLELSIERLALDLGDLATGVHTVVARNQWGRGSARIIIRK